MFDASGTLAHVRQGRKEPYWVVFNSRRPRPGGVGKGCLLFFLVVALAAFAVLTSIASLATGTWKAAPPIVGGALVAIALLLLSRLARRRGSGPARAPDADAPLLVITPEGFVEYVRPDYPTVAIDFSDLASLALRVSASTNSGSSVATAHIWLDLNYRDGKTARWQPRANFGPTEAIVQAIITAQGKFEATH